MDLLDIESRVKHIESLSDDAEMAHSYEDNLYRDFIEHISNLEYMNLKDLKTMAKAILKTQEISFPRWCA